MAFTLPITIRFQHCDLAGIVFYPRYFEMFNLVIEEWFEQVIGVGFSRLHHKERIGVPVVSINTEFRAMSSLEDIVEFTLTVNRIGKSSANLFIQAVCGEEIRCTADLTLVCVDLDSRQTKPWPPLIRNKIETFCKECK